MVRLIDDLLDVSRITRNKLELRTEPVELGPLLAHSIEAIRPMSERARHRLEVDLPVEPIYLDGDPARLTQVFGNLLNNACRYTHPGGVISIGVAREGAEAVVTITDTGVGIPHEMLDHVFEMFTQVDRSLERKQGGLGIGLSLVRQLVELHGGSVSARSDGAGEGSRFMVRLPARAALPADDSSEADAAEIAIGSRRILVVDDNRDAAESLALLLKMSRNDVEIAYDGLEAVEKAATYRPDLILLDIGMPEMNGYDACRAIRQQPGGGEIMIIALTGWGQEEDQRRSQDAGFDHHLVKPVDHAVLKKLLAGAARG
jgi:CheY-like chemotaxis protein